jgi:NDP-sugar pyrophosphorylase family protein
MMTIVLREVQNVEGLGIADIDKHSRIRCFVEKPLPKDAPSKLANTGLYVVSPEIKSVFKEKGVKQIVEEKHRLDFGYDFIPYMTQTGRPVYGYTLKGNWFDVGTPRNYLEAMKNLLHGGFKMLTDFGNRISPDKQIWVQGESNDAEKRRKEIISRIKKGKIDIEGAVLIGRHCQIDDGVRIVNSCIDNYTRISKGAVVENSAVMDRATIGENAQILGSIIGRHTTVRSTARQPTKICDVSVVADDVTIEEGSTLTASKIYPHQHVRGDFRNQILITS